MFMNSPCLTAPTISLKEGIKIVLYLTRIQEVNPSILLLSLRYMLMPFEIKYRLSSAAGPEFSAMKSEEKKII